MLLVSFPYLQPFHSVPSPCILQLLTKLWKFLIKMLTGRSVCYAFLVHFLSNGGTVLCSNFLLAYLIHSAPGWPNWVFWSRPTRKHSRKNGISLSLASAHVYPMAADLWYSRLIWRWFRISSNLMQCVFTMSLTLPHSTRNVFRNFSLFCLLRMLMVMASLLTMNWIYAC